MSSNFTVGLPGRATFDAVMAASRGGNNVDPGEVARTIGTLFDDAMTIQFGAEGSPVLYISVPFFTHQRLTDPTGHGKRYTDEQRRAYTRRVITWARGMRADEISVEQHSVTTDNVVDGEPGENPYRIRIWWD